MKEFLVKYVTKNDEGYNRYSSEIINAKGIMHAHRLAKDHAKAISQKVDSVNEVIEK